MTTLPSTGRPATRALRLLAVALTAVTAYKFLAIAAWVVVHDGWQPQQLPWGFLLVISGPFLVAALLIGRFPRSGTALLMAGGAVLLTISAAYLITTGAPEDPGSDLPLIVLGMPLAAAALVLGGRFLLARSRRSTTGVA